MTTPNRVKLYDTNELIHWVVATSKPQSNSESETKSQSDSLIGTVLDGKYEILSVLGQGGMATVYKAKEVLTGRFVAVKTLVGELNEPEELSRFNQEAKAACALSHPHTVAVHDFGITQMKPYLVLQFVKGKTLANCIDERGPLPESEALPIFMQIADALATAHRQNIVHRDVKPSNIMLTLTAMGNLHAILLDFGIAKLTDEQDALKLTKTGECFGSPLYMSPEQCRSQKVGPQSDIYSFGCLMYDTLTGSPPFTGDTFMDIILKHTTEEPVPIGKQQLKEPISTQVQNIVQRALCKDLKGRYGSMTELLHDLQAARAGERVKAPARQFSVPTIARWIAVVALLGCIMGLFARMMLEFKNSRSTTIQTTAP